ncbi:MAG: shikimate kinase [Gemmatimonadaceae bacterium]
MTGDDAAWRHLVLVGLPGSGKTTVGARLAETLGWLHVDLDSRIQQREKLSIQRIFELHGEAYFRDLEVELTREFLSHYAGVPASGTGRAVLDPGGGWVTNSEAVSMVRPVSRIAYLRIKPETALQRLGLSPVSRPMLGKPPSLARLKELLFERGRVYESADWAFDVDALEPQQVVARLAQLVRATDPQ